MEGETEEAYVCANNLPLPFPLPLPPSLPLSLPPMASLPRHPHSPSPTNKGRIAYRGGNFEAASSHYEEAAEYIEKHIGICLRTLTGRVPDFSFQRLVCNQALLVSSEQSTVQGRRVLVQIMSRIQHVRKLPKAVL